MIGWRAALAVGILSGTAYGAVAPELSPEVRREAEQLDKAHVGPPSKPGLIDHSGRVERGRASFYSKRFSHKKMADGRRMNPNANIAASKTLPLGSVAKVTNLENGKSATVKIEDRGPYVSGRVVDLAPSVARQLDFKDKGVVPVEVKPITLPQPDGGVKLGAGAAEVSPMAVQQAIEETKAMTAPRTPDTAEK